MDGLENGPWHCSFHTGQMPGQRPATVANTRDNTEEERVPLAPGLEASVPGELTLLPGVRQRSMAGLYDREEPLDSQLGSEQEQKPCCCYLQGHRDFPSDPSSPPCHHSGLCYVSQTLAPLILSVVDGVLFCLTHGLRDLRLTSDSERLHAGTIGMHWIEARTACLVHKYSTELHP